MMEYLDPVESPFNLEEVEKIPKKKLNFAHQ
jgi:hypothetical protein